MDLLALQFVEVLVSDVHTGETLKHFTLSAGDVAVADRGYAHAQGIHEAVQQGAEVIVRLNPFRVARGDATGQPVSLCGALKRQPMATIRTLEVVIRSAGGQHEMRGWVHAYRLSAEQASRARQKCRQRHKKGRAKSGEPLACGLGAGADHPSACGALGPDDPGAVPLSLASGVGHKTVEKCARCGRVPSKSAQSPGRGVAPWHIALCLDAGTTDAAPAGGCARRRLRR